MPVRIGFSEICLDRVGLSPLAEWGKRDFLAVVDSGVNKRDGVGTVCLSREFLLGVHIKRLSLLWSTIRNTYIWSSCLFLAQSPWTLGTSCDGAVQVCLLLCQWGDSWPSQGWGQWANPVIRGLNFLSSILPGRRRGLETEFSHNGQCNGGPWKSKGTRFGGLLLGWWMLGGLGRAVRPDSMEVPRSLPNLLLRSSSM